MLVNSIKTKNNFHNYIVIKQSDNTSAIEIFLCGANGSILSDLNQSCTLTILDELDQLIRQKTKEQIVNGTVTFRVTNDLKTNPHTLEITTADGQKFPSNHDFKIFVSYTHDESELRVINNLSREEALAEIDQSIKEFISENTEEYIDKVATSKWLYENNFKPKEAVSTFSDLPQSAELKEIRLVVSENKQYIYDGNNWLDFGSVNLDGLSNYKKDLTTRSVNVMFPPSPLVAAKGDGITDDTDAIQTIIDNLKPYQKIFIPEGEFKLSRTLIFKKDNVEYEQRGMLLDYGIHFEGFKIKATGVKTKRKKAVWDDGVVGTIIKNCTNGIFYIDEVFGYDNGIIIVGENTGTAYNNIHLNYLTNNRCDITFRGLGSGWICENTFHGGRFAVTGDYKETNKVNPGWCIVFDTDSTAGMSYNGNKFLHPSFESKHNGIQFKKASYIYIDNPRFENVDDNWLVQDSEANGLTIITGYTSLLPRDKVKLNGSYNVIIGRLGGMNAMTISGERGIGFDESSDFPSIKSTNGVFNFYDGDGGLTLMGKNVLRLGNFTGISNNTLTLNDGKNKLYFSDVKPTGGRQGDIVINTLAEKKGFAGWIKTSLTWEEFGDVNKTIESGWNQDHLVMGNFHVWFDNSGKMRSKFGKPESELDGKIIGI